MKNKVLVELVVPKIEKSYNVYLPIDKTIGNIIILLNKAISELTEGTYEASNTSCLYNCETESRYDASKLLYDTNIRNGAVLILI